MNDEIRKIDEWLSSLSQESILRITEVIKILKSVRELTDEEPLKVPYDALDKSNLDQTSQQAILLQLWRKNIIKIVDYLQENCIQSWNKEFEEDNSFNEDTMIFMDTPAFEYLYKTLTQRTSKVPTERDVQENKLRLTINQTNNEFIFQSGNNTLKKATFSPDTNEYSILKCFIDHLHQKFQSHQLVDHLVKEPRGQSSPEPKRRAKDVIKAIRDKLGKEIIATDKQFYSMDCEVLRI